MHLLFRSPSHPGPAATVGAEVDPFDAYDGPREPPGDRPWVLVDMIASIDGATAVSGRSGALGGPGDHDVFRALRAVPDVVVVGAATARTEDYGPVRLDEGARARRAARGQAPTPRLALVSGRLELDPDARLFTEASEPPLVFTTEPGLAARGDRLRDRAELVAVGDERVELAAVLRRLRRDGARVALVEGGPSLNGQLVAADLVDEWCQTLAPMLVGGDSPRVAHGPTADDPIPLGLHQVLEDDGYLFGTWRRTT